MECGNSLESCGIILCSLGLKLNKAKCQVAGIKMDDSKIIGIANYIGCSLEAWPLKYLSLPLGDDPLREGFWEPVINK